MIKITLNVMLYMREKMNFEKKGYCTQSPIKRKRNLDNNK